ncbi:hypothetical protein N8487_00165 [bacterium]|nr:hypothetical protein [bacterium]
MTHDCAKILRGRSILSRGEMQRKGAIEKPTEALLRRGGAYVQEKRPR